MQQLPVCKLLRLAEARAMRSAGTYAVGGTNTHSRGHKLTPSDTLMHVLWHTKHYSTQEQVFHVVLLKSYHQTSFFAESFFLVSIEYNVLKLSIWQF
jgi:hypothetical protein